MGIVDLNKVSDDWIIKETSAPQPARVWRASELNVMSDIDDISTIYLICLLSSSIEHCIFQPSPNQTQLSATTSPLALWLL